MNRFIFTWFVFIFAIGGMTPSFAQSDDSAYEVQRQKTNRLLEERNRRFGEFEESLKLKTGIFGLKTKKDMQASIDILKQLVLNDNNIFKETKALLEYKDIERKSIEEIANQSSARINGYVNTISKLQRNKDELQTEVGALQKENNVYMLLCIGMGTLSLLLLVLFVRMKLKA